MPLEEFEICKETCQSGDTPVQLVSACERGGNDCEAAKRESEESEGLDVFDSISLSRKKSRQAPATVSRLFVNKSKECKHMYPGCAFIECTSAKFIAQISDSGSFTSLPSEDDFLTFQAQKLFIDTSLLDVGEILCGATLRFKID